MIARHRSTCGWLGAAALLLAGASSSAGAQRSGAIGCTEEPLPDFILVTYPDAPSARVANDALKALKQYMSTVFSSRVLCMVDKTAADQMLEASGWRADSLLATRDAVVLAGAMRADEVLEVGVVPVGRGYQFTGRLVLARDVWFRDSLPKPEVGENMSIAVKALWESVKKVREQLPHEEKCYQLGREGNFAEAEAAAREGVKAFPDAVISRLCLATVLFEQKKPPAEVLAVTDEILKRDDSNVLALLRAINAYYVMSDTANYARVASKFVSIDPANPAVETIVENLRAWKKADVALPMLQAALAEFGEDPGLLKVQFKILYASDNTKEVISKGEALVRIDSTVVDSLFVIQMASAYAQDSQPQKVAEWYAKGFAKFPNNITIAQRYAQQLNALGQTPQAIDVYRKVLQLNPKTPEVRVRVASFFNAGGQRDSAVAWLRQARTAGDDSTQIAGIAVAIANAMRLGAVESKQIDDYRRMLAVAMFADSVESTPNSQFMWGMAEYGIATSAVTLLQLEAPAPTCALAQEGVAAVTGAQQHIYAGARTQPAAAQQILPALGGIQEWLEAQVKTLCKTG